MPVVETAITVPAGGRASFEEFAPIIQDPQLWSPESPAMYSCRSVLLNTRSGKVLSQQLRHPLMDEEELQQKFRYLAGLRLNTEKVLDLERKIKGIEAVDNVAPLIDELELTP